LFLVYLCHGADFMARDCTVSKLALTPFFEIAPPVLEPEAFCLCLKSLPLGADVSQLSPTFLVAVLCRGKTDSFGDRIRMAGP
jgi:hypothetical protein